MKKYVLITGASGGIGSATAKILASEGWNLYLHYHHGEEKINKLMLDLEKYPVELIPIQANLMNDDGAEKLTNSIFHINGIVYTAGTAPYGLIDDLDDKQIDDMIQIHVKSPIKVIRNLLRKLRMSQSSNIVLISSIWGQTGAASEVMYSTVKGAQIAFVKALSKETARSGVRVNGVAPGAVKTNMISEFSETDLLQLADEIPLGRLAEPEEIADTISFLLSNHSSYITGQVLSVNGGWYT